MQPSRAPIEPLPGCIGPGKRCHIWSVLVEERRSSLPPNTPPYFWRAAPPQIPRFGGCRPRSSPVGGPTAPQPGGLGSGRPQEQGGGFGGGSSPPPSERRSEGATPSGPSDTQPRGQHSRDSIEVLEDARTKVFDATETFRPAGFASRVLAHNLLNLYYKQKSAELLWFSCCLGAMCGWFGGNGRRANV